VAVNRVLLDTSGYSAFMRGHDEIKAALQRADEIYLTPVVLGELLAGFMWGRHRRKNERELQVFGESPRVTVADLDGETARRYAVIVSALRSAGTPVPTNDIWIAASAMQHGLSILTTDAHYTRIPQVLVDFFEP
jgi:tRNA(fMet)-specific endonuclease VapC